MTAGVPPSSTPGTISPAEREARWTLFVRFAIEAASDTEARSVLRQALAGLNEELPLHGEPVVHPRWPRNPDEIWVAELAPDLTRHFPMGVSWILPQNTERKAKVEWPPDIWQRQHGKDDVLLHPAVRGVMICCEARQA